MKAEAAALRELSRTDHSELSTVWRACVDRISYLACVLTVMFVILTFVMIKIVPAFAANIPRVRFGLAASDEVGRSHFFGLFVKYLRSR